VYTLINKVPHAKVAAVCSNLPHEVEWANANEEYKQFGIKVYNDYAEMLKHPGLQAVWVSTSTDVHASQSLAAIEAGLHVLCEKPLSTDMAEVCLEYTSLVA
jgi:myo-inositol 2-dehydrogenase / D-chiro-inositol 1-dehydrogenase